VLAAIAVARDRLARAAEAAGLPLGRVVRIDARTFAEHDAELASS
jgi:hypothetical protein